jgi:hypothetical protein
MSQYDAPPGTLLAFATAPGRVAVELPGSTNGLYTEHLVRELSVKGVRIEDALKRVRLNVRVASNGEQVPWESTSLEGDVYLFPTKVLSEAELDRRFREEYATWNKIKASSNPSDWINYLRVYPDGKFAEVAQVHVRALLASPEPVVRAEPAARPASSSRPSPPPPLLLGPKIAVPARFKGSGNPNSAGTYAFRPVWTPGDEYVFHVLDIYSNVVQRRYRVAVKRVDVAGNQVELSDGSQVDLMGGALRDGSRHIYDVPIQINPTELQIGRKWASHFQQSGSASTEGEGDYEFRVTRREMVKVPAGEFSAFKIEGLGWLRGRWIRNHRISLIRWVVPGINYAVRREFQQFSSVHVLVSARQAVSA